MLPKLTSGKIGAYAMNMFTVNVIESHDSSANMCCVIFAIYYGYQGLQMYLLRLNVEMNII